MARSLTDPDPDPGNANAQSNTNAETIPGPQANMDHPDPDQETPSAEMIPGTQYDIEHPVNNNVPETPSKFAAIGLGQMVLASSRRHPFTSASENLIRRNNAPPSPSPASRPVLPGTTSADEEPVGGRAISALGERLIRNPVNRFAGNDTNEFEGTYPPSRIEEGDVGLTPTRNTRAVTPLVQTPALLMPPHQTPASRIKVAQSPASRLLRPTGPSPTLIVRSTGSHDDGVNATPGVVRILFPNQGTSLVSTPAPNRDASEPQLVRPRTVHEPPRQSRLRSVSFTSALDEDTEMASPSVATAECPTGKTHMTTPQSQTGETIVITPEFQKGGSPPMPHAPRTPHTWISPSQVTPDIMARMGATPGYRNRDEPMEMMPLPPELKPASPDDRQMEDAFWTPNKPGASLNVADFRKKVVVAQNPTPMEYKSPIVNSAPFGIAMAQDFAPIQNVAPIGNPAPAQDAMSPGTTTVRTVISTEITTTTRKTPSPLQSPTPARRPTDNRRRIAAKPHKTGDAPRRGVASTPQRKGNGGAEQNTNRRRTAEHIIPGGINRRQELRTSPRYSLRDSTRGIMPGTYSLTPVRNRLFKAESPSKKK